MMITAMMAQLRRSGKGVRGVLIALALVLAAGCGGDDGPNPAIRIQNNSALTIAGVFYSSCESTSFGDDRLSGTIAPGANQTFTADVTAGCWDVAVVSDTDLDAVFLGNEVTGTLTVNVTNADF